jgi:hypothetical protein
MLKQLQEPNANQLKTCECGMHELVLLTQDQMDKKLSGNAGDTV